MSGAIVWLHEDALRITHPVITAAQKGSRIIHIWDDAYLQAAGYSLKRLVFLYETLCELPLEIIHGNTFDMLQQLDAVEIYIPASVNPFIQEIAGRLSKNRKVILVAEEPFVTLKNQQDFTRFFSYWKKAEKTAFLKNGGGNA